MSLIKTLFFITIVSVNSAFSAEPNVRGFCVQNSKQLKKNQKLLPDDLKESPYVFDGDLSAKKIRISVYFEEDFVRYKFKNAQAQSVYLDEHQLKDVCFDFSEKKLTQMSLNFFVGQPKVFSINGSDYNIEGSLFKRVSAKLAEPDSFEGSEDKDKTK